MLVAIGPSRVALADWTDLETAAREGLINERAHCELKRGLPPSSKNVEISRDIASMTVEGGVLLYGVEDAGGGKAGAVVGMPDAEAVKSRLIAIAQGSVQPSVVCDVRVISHPDDPDRGCVLVVIPPSPVAPHRADERYWGRSSEGKRVLSDAEIAALFAARRNREDDFQEQLASLDRNFDPIPPTARSHGHLYYCARPLQLTVSADTWGGGERVLEVVVAAQLPPHDWGGADLMSLGYTEAHPGGIMAASLSPDDTYDRERRSIRMLIRDDGGIDMASGIATQTRTFERTGKSHTGVATGALLTQLDQAVRVTAHVGRRLAYAGIWRLGVRVTGIEGLPTIESFSRLTIGNTHVYPEPEFLMVTDASAEELNDNPNQVVQRLAAALTRGLGVAERYFPYDSPRDFFRR